MSNPTASMVNADEAAVVTTRPMPPWRRGGPTTNEANSDSPKNGCHVTPPWRRGLNVTKNAASDSRKTSSSMSPLASEDDTSTTAGLSDVEESASTMSRSASESELQMVISRHSMLLYRSRCLPTQTESDQRQGLHCKSVVSSLPGPRAKVVNSPPGLKAKLTESPPPAPAGFVPPPGLEMLNGSAITMPSYTPVGFRKEFMVILKDLAIDRNVARSVRRVRAQRVPQERQAAEYADAITFILEEVRGTARRSFVALLAGLAYAVFEKKQCLEGLNIFFQSIYPDLQAEVPKLSKLVNIELLATLSSVFTADELSPFVALAKA